MSQVKTISSLASDLGISRSWLYKKIEARELPCHRFGNVIRFTEEDIAEIIKQSEQKPITSSSKTKKIEEESRAS
jgi:excisionase family DNA binding protein